jgi:hypothetical protein
MTFSRDMCVLGKNHDGIPAYEGSLHLDGQGNTHAKKGGFRGRKFTSIKSTRPSNVQRLHTGTAAMETKTNPRKKRKMTRTREVEKKKKEGTLPQITKAHLKVGPGGGGSPSDSLTSILLPRTPNHRMSTSGEEIKEHSSSNLEVKEIKEKALKMRMKQSLDALGEPNRRRAASLPFGEENAVLQKEIEDIKRIIFPLKASCNRFLSSKVADYAAFSAVVEGVKKVFMPKDVDSALTLDNINKLGEIYRQVVMHIYSQGKSRVREIAADTTLSPQERLLKVQTAFLRRVALQRLMSVEFKFDRYLSFHNVYHTDDVVKCSLQLIQRRTSGYSSEYEYRKALVICGAAAHDSVLIYNAKGVRLSGTESFQSEGASYNATKEDLEGLEGGSKEGERGEAVRNLMEECGVETFLSEEMLEVLREQIHGTVPQFEFGPGKLQTVTNRGKIINPFFDETFKAAEMAGRKEDKKYLLPQEERKKRVGVLVERFMAEPYQIKNVVEMLIKRVVPIADLIAAISRPESWVNETTPALWVEMDLFNGKYLDAIADFDMKKQAISEEGHEELKRILQCYLGFMGEDSDKGQRAFARGAAVEFAERGYAPLKAVLICLHKIMESNEIPKALEWSMGQVKEAYEEISDMIYVIETEFTQEKKPSEDIDEVLTINRSAIDILDREYDKMASLPPEMFVLHLKHSHPYFHLPSSERERRSSNERLQRISASHLSDEDNGPYVIKDSHASLAESFDLPHAPPL